MIHTHCFRLMERLQTLENKISKQISENSLLLNKLKEIKPIEAESIKTADSVKSSLNSDLEVAAPSAAPTPPVIPVLLFSCNRWHDQILLLSFLFV